MPEARVFHYTFETTGLEREFGITRHAEGLLNSLTKAGDLGKRPIHFAGHSIGGLVVKRALVLALGSVNKDYQAIARYCFSVAFFGTPRKFVCRSFSKV